MSRFERFLGDAVVRHKPLDLALYPWFKRPAVVKIAMYAEGASIQFTGGSFDGLDRVVAALAADPWPWVKFEVTKFHRGNDASIPAANRDKTLDAINLPGFDELWLFGISGGNLLSAAELAAVHAFMDAGGGVLHTGDHASLGQGIAGAIKRVGTMRKYPAPQASSGVWNNTLRQGATPGYQFVDQSDDVPQSIRLKTYAVFPGGVGFPFQRRPHPLFCGANGPIRVFPDHQHEGEATVPTVYPAADWPNTAGGTQQKAEVIAWGTIESPDADVGREVGLVSAYDGHRTANRIGRIVADSTWHHWFDINIDGFDTPAGQAHLANIERYFQNVAAWLAPARKQHQMRTGLIWFASWKDPLVMLDPKIMGPVRFGSTAIDALGQFAPQCLIQSWLIDMLPFKLIEMTRPHFFPEIDLFDDKERAAARALAEEAPPLPVLPLLASSVLTPVAESTLKSGEPSERDLAVIEQAIAEAPQRTMSALDAEVSRFAKLPEMVRKARALL